MQRIDGYELYDAISDLIDTDEFEQEFLPDGQKFDKDDFDEDDMLDYINYRFSAVDLVDIILSRIEVGQAAISGTQRIYLPTVGQACIAAWDRDI